MATAALLIGVTALPLSRPAEASPLLYIVDSTSRLAYMDMGNPTVVQGVVSTGLAGLTAIAFSPTNVMYGIVSVSNGNDLYTINHTTGTSQFVGSLGVGNVTFKGLTFGDNGALYANTTNTGTVTNASNAGSLYTINSGTGAATAVGLMGLVPAGGLPGTDGNSGVIRSAGDLAFYFGGSPGTLYGSVTVGSNSVSRLAAIDTGTGAATVIGGLLPGGNGAFDGMTNSAGAGPLFSVDAQYIYSTNTTTGAVSIIVQYTSGQFGSARDAAMFGEAIPEPASLALFGTGLAGLWAIRRRRQSA